MNAIDNRKWIEKDTYDVIVVGGGIAGIAAAVSASRNNMRTLLMEKTVLLGGLSTAGLISWYEPLCDSKGNQMIGGIAEELIRLSIKYGFDNLSPSWQEGEEDCSDKGRFATHFSPTVFAVALDRYMEENGVDLVLDCLAVFPIAEGKRLRGIAAETKEGRVYYGANQIIDATGDASIFASAGLPTVNGENYMVYVAQGYSDKNIQEYNESKEKSMLSLRKWYSIGSDMKGNGHPKGMKRFSGVTAEDITEFVVTGRKMLFDKIREDDRKSRDLSMLPSMPQFRTIRRIVGEYDFMAVDGERYDDTIGSCGDFRLGEGAGKHYHIPFRSIYNRACENLMAAGRIISCNKLGWEISRVIPVCALTGQAAGTAAALAIESERAVSKLDINELQGMLRQAGVLFVD